MIQLFGTENQKKALLPPLVGGEAITGAAITEPDAGSDVASVATRAIPEEGEYIINGSKSFTTNGTTANFIQVLCLTNPEAESRHQRHSVITVETDREGFEATPLKNKLGIRASETAELSFSDVHVPRENLVGTEGEGFPQLGAMEMAIKHVRERRQFGKPLASFQATRFKIAEMATRIEAARNLYYKATWMLDRGKRDSKLISMAKWYSGEVAVRVADEALQLHGGYGYIGDYDIERFYRDAKIVEIYEGTKEIEKIIIARSILGKA
jgi:alkylation response protein AidB-like acyl-CoA dehydrogenase